MTRRSVAMTMSITKKKRCKNLNFHQTIESKQRNRKKISYFHILKTRNRSIVFPPVGEKRRKAKFEMFSLFFIMKGRKTCTMRSLKVKETRVSKRLSESWKTWVKNVSTERFIKNIFLSGMTNLNQIIRALNIGMVFNNMTTMFREEWVIAKLGYMM